MKLYCLSSDAAKPCFVMSFKGLMIMLDCGLSVQPMLNFLPVPPVPSARLSALPAYTPPHLDDPQLEGELKECCGRVFVDSIPEFCPPLDKVIDYSQLDVILISNYTCMMALPFITEETGFKGQVFATEPTLQIGRFYLEEISEWLEGGGTKGERAKRWKELVHLLPAPLALAARPRHWRRLYSRDALAKALARVRVVGYEQSVDLCGALTATPHSSGYCLGSANWVLATQHERVAYVSGSSTLTTHPRPINQAALKGADLLLLAQLTQTPAHNPDNMLGDLCVHAAVTLRAGGSVLVPVYPSGVLYDLLECLGGHLEAAGLAGAPMYVVSPAADASLAYSNILAEWVSGGKRARVLLPEEPFPHAALARAGRLKAAARLHDQALAAHFRQPCVVFAGHPSLRLGPAVHLLELWGSDPSHALIFTEPDFPLADALAPFQPLAMKAFHCPIDTSLNYSQANKLVRELKPKTLAICEQYAPPPSTPANAAPPHNAGGRSWVSGDMPTVVLRRGGAVSVSVSRGVVGGVASAALAKALRGAVGGRRPMRATLSLRAGSLKLEAMSEVPDSEPATWQWVAGAGLGASGLALKAQAAALGLGTARLDRDVLHIPRLDALLHLSPTATHVLCDGPRASTQRLRALIQAAADAPVPPPERPSEEDT